MKTSKIMKAVVFDLDDTLISEWCYVESGFLHIADLVAQGGNHSKKAVYELLQTLFKATPRRVFNRMFEALSMPYSEDDVLNLVAAYRNHQPNIDFYKDVRPTLKRLKEAGIKTGIITDGFKQGQRKKLEAVGAQELFDHIIMTDELGPEFTKPHPRSFELMRDALGVDYDEMVYVGDNPAKDFFIGSVYPLQTVRIMRGGVYKDAAYLNCVKEHHRIDDLSELFRELESSEEVLEEKIG